MSVIFYTLLALVKLTWLGQYTIEYMFSSSPANGSEFDFIIVGSGSAGSVVAARLAESGHSVLLIEAGGPPHPLLSVPAFAPFFWGTAYDWNHKPESNSDAHRALADHKFPYPRGKMLGGTSMLHWMFHVRGSKSDFDEWEDLGNEGWGYEDILPYFKNHRPS